MSSDRATGVRARVLLIAEDATLAHLGRVIVIAKALPPAHYDVQVACSARGARFLELAQLRHVPIETLDPAYFAARLARGQVVHTEALLERSVADDLALFARERPDVVLGDFRISLGISAACAHVPYVALQNAHWCEQSLLPFPLPSHPWVNRLGLPLTRLVFRYALPMGLKGYLRPFNRVRQTHGLAPLPSLRAMYTQADRTLYADLPNLSPVAQLPPGHRYIGPIIWEPPVPLPDFWETLPVDRPLVFVNVGSSGDQRLTQAVLEAVAGMPVSVALATAGKAVPTALPANVFATAYLPGKAMSARAALLVTNGGSATGYMALAAGRPQVAVPSNMDQYFFANAIAHAGLGKLLRADRVTPQALRRALEELLGTPTYHQRAAEEARAIAATDAGAQAAEVVAALLNGST